MATIKLINRIKQIQTFTPIVLRIRTVVPVRGNVIVPFELQQEKIAPIPATDCHLDVSFRSRKIEKRYLDDDSKKGKIFLRNFLH